MSTHIQIRISASEKAEVKEILDKLGLSYSGAIKLFFRQLIQQGGLPFDVKTQAGDCQVNFEIHSIDPEKHNPARFKNLLES